MSSNRFISILGPGLLYAGAAIGVSHLVQSTRAGADFGFELMWILLLANILKYPFFEVAGRYVFATGDNLIHAYARQGKWVLVLFLFLTLLTMFPIQAAVTMVTAGLAINLSGLHLNAFQMSAILMLLTMVLLIIGRFRLLDNTIKVVVLLLSVSTIVALIAAIFNHSMPAEQPQAFFKLNEKAHIYFLIAFIGWMPSPIDVSVWSSLWSQAKNKQMKFKPTLKEVLLEFRIGYFGTMLAAAAFLSLGSLVLHGANEKLSDNGAVFAGQLISLYTRNIGQWAYPVIAIAALTTMLSTTITVMDAYPRVLQPTLNLLRGNRKSEQSRKHYISWMIIVSAGGLLLIYLAGNSMRFMVDLATSLSFVTAPVLAVLNYRAIHAVEVSREFRPGMIIKIWSWLGIAFLTLFTIFYLYWIVVS